MEFKTLQEFLTFTKGQEYLIAIGAIVLFSFFWFLLDRKQQKQK